MEPRSLLTAVNTRDSLMEGAGTFSDAEPYRMEPIRPAHDGSEFDILGAMEQSDHSRKQDSTHTDAIDGIQIQGMMYSGRVDDRKCNEVLDIEEVKMKVDDRDTTGGPCNPGSAGISTIDTGMSSNARVEQQMDADVSLPNDQHGGL